MKTLTALPTPAILIADDNPKTLAKITKDIHEALAFDRSSNVTSFLSHLGQPRIVAVGTPNELRTQFRLAGGELEPCVLITDSIGEISLRHRVKQGALPLMKVILHTHQKNDHEFIEMLTVGLIDVPIPKGNPEALRSRAAGLYRAYWRQSALVSLRKHIEFSSRGPERKCYQTDEKKPRWLNLFEVYSEIIKGGPVGERLELLWADLMALEGAQQ